MSTQNDVTNELRQFLVSVGVEPAWIDTYFADLTADDWNRYNTSDTAGRQMWADGAIRQWANDLYTAGTPVPEDVDLSAAFEWTPTKTTAQSWGDADTASQAAPEAAAAAQRSAFEGAERAAAEGNLEGIQANMDLIMAQQGMSGEVLLGYEDQLRRSNKLNDMGFMTEEAQKEFLLGMREYAATYGLRLLDLSDPAAAIESFNSMGAGQKWGVFGRIFETEHQDWYSVNVPGMGEVRVLQSDIEQITARLPDVGFVEVEAAMVAAHQVGVEDWELVLVAAEATDKLFFDVDISEVPLGQGAAGVGSAAAVERERTVRRRRTYNDIADTLATGTRLYGDPLLGYLHAVSPGLAAKVWEDPYNLTAAEAKAKDSVLKRVDDAYLQSPLVDIRYDEDALTWLRELGPAGEKETVEVPSGLDISESMRGLYRSWFLANPSDDELANFVDYVNAQQAGYASTKDTAFNPYQGTAGTVEQAPTVGVLGREYLRSHDDYAALQGNRPMDMDEETYAMVMQRKATEVLGAAEGTLATASAQVGMRTGDPSSVAQHALYSGAGSKSSTFMGRLARGANALREMT